MFPSVSSKAAIHHARPDLCFRKRNFATDFLYLIASGVDGIDAWLMTASLYLN